MDSENLAALRHFIETAQPRKCQPDWQPKESLSHGWMLPYLLAADDFTWKRWSHWYDLMQAGKIVGDGIPQIAWCPHGNPAARKMLERTLDSITRHGGWKGWSYFNYLMDWLLYAFGHPGHNAEPKEPAGAEGASGRLYQMFNLETLLAYPYDFLGDILAENQHGRHAGFFPTDLERFARRHSGRACTLDTGRPRTGVVGGHHLHRGNFFHSRAGSDCPTVNLPVLSSTRHFSSFRLGPLVAENNYVTCSTIFPRV